MSTHLFRQLDTEWVRIAASTEGRLALARWAEDEHHLNFCDLDTLIAFTEQRGEHERKDRVLAALAQRAATDQLAGRTLLQCLLPGLRALAISRRWQPDNEETDATIIASAWHHIRRYPIERRPLSIAANILLDTKYQLCGANRRSLDATPAAALSDGRHLPPAPTRTATDQLIDLVADAVRQHVITTDAAKLILQTRVLDITTEQLAVGDPRRRTALRTRRQRAEHKLAEHLR